MTRVLVTALALAAFPLSSHGEEAAVHLTVQPMPAPKPALKYQLLPEVRELSPGNAAPNYLKCFMEQQAFFYNKEAAAERARYQTMPLAELPLDKLRNYGGGALKQADWAARQNAIDWQTLERIQNGGMETLTDELGPFQDLAAASRSGSEPSWLNGTSTTHSAPPRRCSRWAATSASIPRSSPTWSGSGLRISAWARWRKSCNNRGAPTSTGH